MTILTTAVIGDLTAVYCARSGQNPSRRGRSINYKRLNEVLLKAMGVENWESNTFYTLFDPQNVSQVKFVDGLKEIGWNVKTFRGNKDTRFHQYPTAHRFDAQIVYDLATSAEDHVLIISDSMDLVSVIKQMKVEEPDTKITIAFFQDCLDKTWRKVLKDKDRGFDFIDLDEVLYDDVGYEDEPLPATTES